MDTLPPDALQAALAALNLNTTLGPLLIGRLVSAVLFGITSTQTWVYYQRGYGDKCFMKAIVAILCAIDTFDMALICHILYWYLVTNYGNPLALQRPVWSIILSVMVTSATQTIVRCMFAWRVHKLSEGNWVITGIIVVATILDFVFGIIITVKAFHATFADLKRLDPLIWPEFLSGLIGDAVAALALCYLLYKSRAHFYKKESVINRLMAYVVNTGLLTAVIWSISLVLFARQPDNLLYVAVYFQVSKAYVNAFLAMLNAREALRERSGNMVSLPLGQLPEARSRVPHAGPGYASAMSTYEEEQIEVVVETKIHTSVEAEVRPSMKGSLSNA